MKKSQQLIILFLLFLPYIVFAQDQRELKRTFVDAEYQLLFDEYKDLLPLFKELYDNGKETANMNYRIGQCYLQIKGEKEKAISYLKEAVNNNTSYAKEKIFLNRKRI